MSLKDKLNPWNWFHHEESGEHRSHHLPIKRSKNRGMATQNTHPIAQLQNQIDHLFDDAFKGFGFPSLSSEFSNSPLLEQGFFKPNVNVSGDANSYFITLDMPGLKQEDISIEIKNDTLKIHGEKQTESENKDRHFYRVERCYGSFERTLALPGDVIVDEIEANMKDGVLSLTLPRQEQDTSDVKKIDIK